MKRCSGQVDGDRAAEAKRCTGAATGESAREAEPMSRATIVVLATLVIIDAFLAAPRMQDSAIGKFLSGKCDSPPQPTECFPNTP